VIAAWRFDLKSIVATGGGGPLFVLPGRATRLRVTRLISAGF
jgi:hypothetical protein